MKNFLKHIGKHNDRKVAVIFREVPDETHMCLVIYTEILNRNLHDAIMRVIESDIGQASENLADALNRTHTVDGKLILPLLHHEGFLKKVQTELIVMTPSPNVSIKLSELNRILDEMKKGEEAVKKLDEMDRSRGLQDPVDVARRMRTESLVTPNEPMTKKSSQSSPNGFLSDSDLAKSFRQQAERMAAEAKGLMDESQRLYKEASALDSTTVESIKATIITETTSDAVPSAKTGRTGRPKKTVKAVSNVT
jgi:hypothetical protein